MPVVVPCTGDEKIKCLADDFAKVLIAPKHAMDMILNQWIDSTNILIKKSASTVVDAFKGNFNFFTNEFPQILPNMIGRMADKTVEGFDKIGNAIGRVNTNIDNVLKTIGNKEIKGYPNIFGPIEVLIAIIMIKLQSFINMIFLGSDADKIMADPNKSPDKLWNSVSNNAELFKKLSQHPEFTSKFHDLIVKFTEAILTSMEVARPEIDKVSNKISEIITSIGNKSASTVEASVHNIMTGIFKAIPIVGTIIAALDAGDRFAKGLMTKFGDKAGLVAGGVMPYLNILNSVAQKSISEVESLQKSLAPIIDKVSKSVKEDSLKSDRITHKISGGRRRSRVINNINKPNRRNSATIKKTCNRINGFIKRHHL